MNVDLHQRKQGDIDDQGSSRPLSVGQKCIEKWRVLSLILAVKDNSTSPTKIWTKQNGASLEIKNF